MFYLKGILPELHMIYSEIIEPILRAFVSIWEHLFIKVFIVLAGGGLSELFALDLFSTPSAWWKGLVWLVVIDWLSGSVIALIDGRFDFHKFNEKWRQIIGYFAACAMAAILANTFPNVFYYFQFVIYVSFFIKEGRSILKTFKLLAFIQVVIRRLESGQSFFSEITGLSKEVDEQADRNREDDDAKINKRSGYEAPS